MQWGSPPAALSAHPFRLARGQVMAWDRHSHMGGSTTVWPPPPIPDLPPTSLRPPSHLPPTSLPPPSYRPHLPPSQRCLCLVGAHPQGPQCKLTPEFGPKPTRRHAPRALLVSRPPLVQVLSFRRPCCRHHHQWQHLSPSLRAARGQLGLHRPRLHAAAAPKDDHPSSLPLPPVPPPWASYPLLLWSVCKGSRGASACSLGEVAAARSLDSCCHCCRVQARTALTGLIMASMLWLCHACVGRRATLRVWTLWVCCRVFRVVVHAAVHSWKRACLFIILLPCCE